jgi:hypothetical protein
VYDAASSRGQRQPSSMEALLEESILSVRCYQIFHDIHDSHLNMFSNRAAWLMAEKAKPSEVKPAPYIAAPDPCVIGKGLEYVQAGVDTLKKGVCTKKVIITL